MSSAQRRPGDDGSSPPTEESPSRGWVFDDPPNLGVFLARPVFEGREDLDGVTHDDDGDWLLYGETDDDDDGPDFWVLAHLAHVVELWPRLEQVADLPLGWWAQYVDGDWERAPLR